MRTSRIAAGCATWLLAAGLAVAAGAQVAPQSAKKPTTAPKPASPSAKVAAATRPAPVATPDQGYSYRVDGRRDPFLSLVSRGIDRTGGRKAEGVAGLGAGEIALKGILYSRGAYLAMVQGPDLKTYIVHANDRLADGTIRAITADSLVILQEVNDPLSLTKQREVRKTLRALEEVK